jgi:hypothetical protein
MTSYVLQPASRMGRAIVTQVATAQTQATQSTPPFGSQTRQIRVATTLSIWATISSTTVDVTANSSAALIVANSPPEYFGCSPGQSFNFLSTSTSTGYVSLVEMT